MLDINLFREGGFTRVLVQNRRRHLLVARVQTLHAAGIWYIWARRDECCHAEKGGNPDLVREAQRRRFADPAAVDRVIQLDKEWRDGKLQQPLRS